jgi:hypothetical protein
MEVEKEKDAKRRRSSAAIPEGELEEGKKLLRFRDNFNIKWVECSGSIARPAMW